MYEGVQLSVDRKVAIKVLHPNYSVRGDFQERFSREAKAIARLNHTNCITLYDFGVSEEFDSLFMVTEYVEGRELFDVMLDGVGLREALDCVIQIADAVEHAHQHNILHRDLKPENVLVAEDDVVKVLDFGMARIIDELASQNTGRLTEQGAIYGTPAYMSPEQCKGDIDVTPQTDLYSLGVILYELVEGRLPFESPQILEILGMHVNREVPPLTVDVPERLESLIMSMMAKRQVERPSSAAIVADTLRSVLLEIPDESGGRDTLDASQEINRTLLEFGDSDATGEGIRSTLDGLEESSPGDDEVPGDPDSKPEERPSRRTFASAPSPLARPPAALESTEGEPVSVPVKAHETFTHEGDFRRARWPIAVVLLLVATVVAAFVMRSGEESASTDATRVNEPSVETPPATEDEPEPGPEVVADPAAAPSVDERPRETPDEVDERHADGASQPEVSATEGASTDEEIEPDSEPRRDPAASATRGKKSKEVAAEPTSKGDRESAADDPAPKERSEGSASDDGKGGGESGTTKAEESKDELPTIRFTY